MAQKVSREGLTLDAELINPFIRAIQNVLQKETKSQVLRTGKPSLTSGGELAHEITSVIGLVGEVSGVFLISVSAEYAFSFFREVVGVEATEIDEVVLSGIAELSNTTAGQAAIALDNEMLIQAQRDLLDSFIELMAGAIDAKSPYTGGHCQRVPELTKMLAKAACESDAPPFRDFDLDEEGWYELHLAGWLHDCGKVVTPEFIVDKACKLETIYNRIHEIRTRFEVLRRDAEIECLKAKLAGDGDLESLDAAFAQRCRQLEEEFAFIAASNLGAEFFEDESVDRLRQIGEQTWLRHFDHTLGLSWEELARLGDVPAQDGPVPQRLLDDRPDHMKAEYNLGEIYNLSISRGTLTAEERETINNHIVVAIGMLDQLRFPRQLSRVPEYAGGHHEKMDGTGYPKGLTRDEMSLPTRMMAIADIFEALTAGDRPYKKAKMLSECLRIMGFMRDDDHIDPDLFDLFLPAGIWSEYADQFLDPAQIDDIDIGDYLGDR